MTTTGTTHKMGRDIEVGDVVDYTPAGFQIASFTEYDSPLIPTTGPGRIAHALNGSAMAIYDNHPMRVRTAS
jgi:hypothetical protein